MTLSDEDINEFVLEFLNLIAHYKQYFYKYMKSMSFFYVSVSKTVYNWNVYLTTVMQKIVRIINLIPRIYVYYHDTVDQGFNLKYNLFKTICISRNDANTEILLFDISNNYRYHLLYKLSRNVYTFIFDDYKLRLYDFDQFFYETVPVPSNKIRKSDFISTLSIYTIIVESKFKNWQKRYNRLLEYISNNYSTDYNLLENKIALMKRFSKSEELINKLIQLEKNLNSPVYMQTMSIIMKNWKNVIKDKNIYKINELLVLPKHKRINIETLMRY